MKYVMIRAEKDGMALDMPVIFPNNLVHKHIADQMTRYVTKIMPGYTVRPVSAGEFDHATCTCSGKSESLGMNSREKQDDLIIRMNDYGGGWVDRDVG